GIPRFESSYPSQILKLASASFFCFCPFQNVMGLMSKVPSGNVPDGSAALSELQLQSQRVLQRLTF
ncbi:hypothetical protein, partial [Kluyvera sp.]